MVAALEHEVSIEDMNLVEAAGFKDGLARRTKRDFVEWPGHRYFVKGQGTMSTCYALGYKLGLGLEVEEMAPNFYHVGRGVVRYDGRGWVATLRKDLMDVNDPSQWIGSVPGVYPKAVGRFATVKEAVEALNH
jgi:hypothetical protein